MKQTKSKFLTFALTCACISATTILPCSCSDNEQEQRVEIDLPTSGNDMPATVQMSDLVGTWKINHSKRVCNYPDGRSEVEHDEDWTNEQECIVFYENGIMHYMEHGSSGKWHADGSAKFIIYNNKVQFIPTGSDDDFDSVTLLSLKKDEMVLQWTTDINEYRDYQTIETETMTRISPRTDILAVK